MSGISRLNPLITRFMAYLLSGSHQVRNWILGYSEEAWPLFWILLSLSWTLTDVADQMTETIQGKAYTSEYIEVVICQPEGHFGAQEPYHVTCSDDFWWPHCDVRKICPVTPSAGASAGLVHSPLLRYHMISILMYTLVMVVSSHPLFAVAAKAPKYSGQFAL